MYKVTSGQLLQAVNPGPVINQQKLCVCFFFRLTLLGTLVRRLHGHEVFERRDAVEL